MPHLIYILFMFALGACVGSFLNVVVWRFPRIEIGFNDPWWRAIWLKLRGLTFPASHCPNCKTPLGLADNIPVFGWLALKGKCRYCGQPISARYPLVEFFCGAMFVLYYIAYFVLGWGACGMSGGTQVYDPSRDVFVDVGSAWQIARDWPIFALHLFMLSALVAMSLIDLELYEIPIELCWIVELAALIVHPLAGHSDVRGSLNTNAPLGAVALGGGLGLIVSLIHIWLRPNARSFPEGEPALEVDRSQIEAAILQAKAEGREVPPMPPILTVRQVYREIVKEMRFCLFPLIGAIAMWLAYTRIPSLHTAWDGYCASHDWFTALLGSVLGLLGGGATIWFFRIFGTLAFRRVAMGLGDIHLMAAAGACIGAGGAVAAFFIAPFFGIALAIWCLITGKRREMQFGPYLSAGVAVVLLAYCPIMNYLASGVAAFGNLIQSWAGR